MDASFDIADFKKGPANPAALVTGTFKLCQDSIEGDYWLVLENDGRKVTFSSGMFGPPPDKERLVEEVEAHMTDEVNDHEVWAHGSYSDLMAQALRWLAQKD